MNFKQWILQFTNNSLHDSDFAHDVETDQSFPDSNNYDEIHEYLTSRGASDRVLDVFDEAWEEFSKL